MKELTAWFPGNATPARPGIYEIFTRQHRRYRCFARFDTNGCWTMHTYVLRSRDPHTTGAFNLLQQQVGIAMPKLRDEYRYRWRGFTTPQE